jgi:hypothetical protein
MFLFNSPESDGNWYGGYLSTLCVVRRSLSFERGGRNINNVCHNMSLLLLPSRNELVYVVVKGAKTALQLFIFQTVLHGDYER